MGEFEWTNTLVIRLMQEFEKRPELWDPSHEMYRVQTLKYESWRELAQMFECDIADLRKKLNSLFASHRREKAKIRAGGRSNWFLYPHMNFLPSHIDPDASAADSPNQKNRFPVKEASPPVAASDEEEVEAEEMLEEHLEESAAEEQTEEYIVVKQEPLGVEPQVPRPSRPSHDYKRLRNRNTELSANTHKPRLLRPIKRRRLSKNSSTPETQTSNNLDIRLAEALKLLRRADLTRRKDECDSFGEYIADSLRKHDDRTQAMIKQAINNIIFEQEMKKYGNQHYVVISGIEENPLILESDKA